MTQRQRRLAPGSEEWWRWVLTDSEGHFERIRPLFVRIPSPPRCKLCGAPFKGIGGAILGPLGFRPWAKNPSMCRACITSINKHPPGGAEIECTLLFADIRGSSSLAERASATEYAALLRRFYSVGSQAIIDANGFVDKFVGDEVVAMFIPVYSGVTHAAPAIRAAGRLLAATGHDQPDGPWLSLGIGVHTGPAFIGTVAVGDEVSDFTALGDSVNIAARLASAAGPGELLVSEDALANAGATDRAAGLERREVQLRGREQPLAIRVADVTAASAL